MTDPNDRKDQLCTECGVGRYQETSIHDDWDGVLHCTNKECNYEVKRYKWKDNPPPKPEKVKLSPAAQAVLDAAINAAESPDAEAIAAAALRAAADQWKNEIRKQPSTEFIIGIKNCIDALNELADELERLS
jgi:hypothetical protein